MPRASCCCEKPSNSNREEPAITAFERLVHERVKAIFASVCLLALTSFSPAEAKGCIKGAIVGGVAGHMAGHGKLGAAAGCVVGHHEANKPDPNNSNAQAPSGQK